MFIHGPEENPPIDEPPPLTMPHRLRPVALLASLACGSALAATPLPLPPGTGMCAALQAYLRADRLRELVSDKAQGLQIAGHRASVEIHFEGTGLAPSALITDMDTGEPFDTGLGSIDGEPRGDGAVVTWGGLHQVLLMARENKGGATVALDGGESCAIEHALDERVAPSSVEPGLCRRILRGRGPKEIQFARPVTLTEESLAARWHGELHDVTPVGAARVDIANDGKPVDVVQMTTSLRQPDICTVRLWDVLSADGKRLANDAERRSLAARGIVVDETGGSIGCYGETHFLLDGKRVLLETLEHSQSNDGDPDVRRVDVVEHGRLRRACETTSTQAWNVTPVPPATPSGTTR